VKRYYYIWKIARYIYDKFNWNIRFYENNNWDVWVKFMDVSIKDNEWYIRHGKEVPDLLEQLKESKKSLASSHEYASRIRDELMQCRAYAEDLTNRYEADIIHFKDIIQAKDLLIEKLKSNR
jgi:hypothetical protein